MSYRQFWRLVLRSMAGEPFVFPLKTYEWGVLVENGSKPYAIDEDESGPLNESRAREMAVEGNLKGEARYTVLCRPVGAWEKV